MCTANTKEQRKLKKTNKICLGILFKFLRALFIVLRYYVDRAIDFIFSLFWESHQPLPALSLEHKMLAESAVSLAKKIRNKELKSVDLVKASIERIKLVNPYLNAVTDQRYEDALKEAEEIDRLIESGLSEEYFQNKPFLGVPFTCKESHAVRGLRHTLGAAARRGARAEVDAECVRLMRAAGAVPVAVTNVPEINKWQETRNLVFGQTANPRHAGRTVGGSSGGEAALMAAQASVVALCSDIGGSTRMPAFYCGLFGYNPTAGATSLKGSALRTGAEDTMASIGFVSRHVEDLAPLTAVVAAEKAPMLALDRPVKFEDIKFYYVESAPDLRVSAVCSELRQTMKDVVSALRAAGAAPAPFAHPGFAHMFSLWRHRMAREAEDFASVLTDHKGRANALVEVAKTLFGASEYTLGAVYMLVSEQLLPAPDAAWAEGALAELRHDLEELLGDNGVLLFPSAPHPAPYHYSAFLRPYNFAYWAVFNALRFPAVQVPVGLTGAGLPLGLQAVSAPRRDAAALAAASRLAELCGGYVPPRMV